MPYILVQRSGFMSYFLSAWHNGDARWDSLRARALTFDGPTAQQVAKQLNAQRPAAPIPVTIERIP